LFKRTVALLKAANDIPNLTKEKTKLEKELQSLKVIPTTSREKKAELENQIGKLETLIKTATRIKANPDNAKVIQISVEGTDPPKREVADSTKVTQTRAELNVTRGKLYPKQAVTESTTYRSRIVEQVYNRLRKLMQ
jgi:phage shock protein A